MRRRLFTFLSAVSLLLCVATVVLWVRGVGRTEGWCFKPSPPILLQPPDEDLPSKWCVQWQIGWGGDAGLSVERQFKPIPRQPTVGFSTLAMNTRRWNPLPQSERVVSDIRIAGRARMPDGRPLVAYRTKPAMAWSRLGITYTSYQQEFGKFPNLDAYFTSPGEWVFASSAPLPLRPLRPPSGPLGDPGLLHMERAGRPLPQLQLQPDRQHQRDLPRVRDANSGQARVLRHFQINKSRASSRRNEI